MLRLSRFLPSASRRGVDLSDALWRCSLTFREAVSTSLGSLDDSSSGKEFASYTVWKGKAALSVAPTLPTFSKLESGGPRVSKNGAVMQIFFPAVGQRKYDYTKKRGISTTRLLAADDAMVPISSPLTPPSGDAEETDRSGNVVKRLKVQAIKKDIKQSPKKVNLVARLVRGMRVEDALLQLQVTVKRAAKTVYQVIHSARANAAHNHGLNPDKLIVEEAFVGKGLYLKRLSYHARGRCGIMVRPRCRLTVVVREATAEEEAKIAKLKVSNYKKLTRKERQLMPHRLIEVSPQWARKRKEEAGATA